LTRTKTTDRTRRGSRGTRTRSTQTGDALTPQQQRFVDEYVVDLNATAAAIRANYSKRSARSIASEHLTKPNIAAAIAAALEARATRTSITQDRVLAELALLAFSDVTHYRVTDGGAVVLAPGAPAGAMRALQSIKQRITRRGRGQNIEVIRDVFIRLWDKPGPLKLAGQHVGLFTEKVEHSGTVTLEDALTASRQRSHG
jgi:phage terminase small subunit